MRALLCDEPASSALSGGIRRRRARATFWCGSAASGSAARTTTSMPATSPTWPNPRVIGHELGGEVAKAPSGSALRTGQVVAIEPYLWCGTCRACRTGRTNCCQRLEVLGVHRDGGACDYIAVPERNVVPADGLSVTDAAMVEFLAIGRMGSGGRAPGRSTASSSPAPVRSASRPRSSPRRAAPM